MNLLSVGLNSVSPFPNGFGSNHSVFNFGWRILISLEFFYEAWPNQWTDQTSDQIVSSLGFLEEFDWILNIYFKVQFMDLDLGLIQHYCVSLYHDVAR